MTSSSRQYRDRRDFGRTPEPRGNGMQPSDQQPIFVIQRHDARRLHFDLRLEIDGVLKTWVVPKGPSTDPSDRRLALRAEDHPLEYASFEGVIPEGEYGAGPVQIWDRGTFRNITEDGDGPVAATEALQRGHLKVHLEGEKISGGFALQAMAHPDEERWLLVKVDDDHADARRNPVFTENRSVASGRTLGEIAAEAGRTGLALLAGLLLTAAVLTGGCAAENTPVAEQVAAIEAEVWLRTIDADSLQDAYAEAAEELRASRTRQDWTSNVARARRQLGDIVERHMDRGLHSDQPAGYQTGSYVLVSFLSDFTERQGVEELVVMKREDRDWRPVRYIIDPSP